MLDTLVLRPLPMREPERVFAIGAEPPPDAQWTMQTVRLSVVDEWDARAESLDGVEAFRRSIPIRRDRELGELARHEHRLRRCGSRTMRAPGCRRAC